MSSERIFLESLIRQSTLNPKGTITGKRQDKNALSSGYQMPWDIPEEENIVIKEEVIVENVEEPAPKVSIALKLGQVSRNLSKLKSEIF
jgi:hypothetical protein